MKLKLSDAHQLWKAGYCETVRGERHHRFELIAPGQAQPEAALTILADFQVGLE